MRKALITSGMHGAQHRIKSRNVDTVVHGAGSERDSVVKVNTSQLHCASMQKCVGISFNFEKNIRNIETRTHMEHTQPCVQAN